MEMGAELFVFGVGSIVDFRSASVHASPPRGPENIHMDSFVSRFAIRMGSLHLGATVCHQR